MLDGLVEELLPYRPLVVRLGPLVAGNRVVQALQRFVQVFPDLGLGDVDRVRGLLFTPRLGGRDDHAVRHCFLKGHQDLPL